MDGLKKVCWVLVFSSLMNYADVIDVGESMASFISDL